MLTIRSTIRNWTEATVSHRPQTYFEQATFNAVTSLDLNQ